MKPGKVARLIAALLVVGFSAQAGVSGASEPRPALQSVVCNESYIQLRGPWGQARFAVEVADSTAERNLGLMHRDHLPLSAGMLFVYETPRAVSFWMENTRIPLDMLFFDETGRLLRLHENAIPFDKTTISGGEGVLVVLELNGGLAAALGVTRAATGETVLAHPSISPAVAALPCEAAN